MNLEPAQIAAAMGAEILAEGGPGSPGRATIDSGATGAGDLFFGLRGERVDGGEFAPAAIAAGAWGVVVDRSANVQFFPLSGQKGAFTDGSWVFGVDDPLVALQGLALEWRRTLGARVVGITGSVGKTSVKDIARALLPGAVHANSENLNTEIGLPLTVLEAPLGTDLLVLEMAMRGAGQIAELAAIAEPEVAVITNVGPVHVELLGSVEAIAAAKAEVLAALPEDGTAVIPVEAGELEPHLAEVRGELLRFGPGGDVEAIEARVAEGVTEALVAAPSGRQAFHFPFAEAHNLTNALAAVAVGVALGAPLGEMADRAANIGFSRFRGERLELGDGIVLVNDCYNANPVSMRAALDHLGTLEGERRIAVLGEMAELGAGASGYHREVGAHARRAGIDLLVGVGEPARDYDPDELVAAPEEAAELLAAQAERGDVVLVKGSRSAGLEAVAEGLAAIIEEEAAAGGGD
jgi:UDP-N-acetylmuramoyl-tripeptide--D-alanyl-D-alanine ligase